MDQIKVAVMTIIIILGKIKSQIRYVNIIENMGNKERPWTWHMYCCIEK